MKEKIELIKKVIKKNGKIEIVYLKKDAIKTTRVVKPNYIGELEYKGVTFTGIKAYCYEREEDRTFRVDKILEIKEID